MIQIHRADADVVPERVKQRCTAHKAIHAREFLVQESWGAQIAALHVDEEAAESRECRIQNVHLTMSATNAGRLGNVRIAEREAQFVHVKAMQRAAFRLDCTSELTAPRIRKRNAVELAQQRKVERIGAHVHVGKCDNWSTHTPCHASAHARVKTARVHVRDGVLQHVQVRWIVADQQIRDTTALPGEGRRQPGDVIHGHRVTVHRHVIAHRQITAPRDLTDRTPAGRRQLEVRQREPDRIA